MHTAPVPAPCSICSYIKFHLLSIYKKEQVLTTGNENEDRDQNKSLDTGESVGAEKSKSRSKSRVKDARVYRNGF
jgi:hypothetical protein